LRAVVGFLARLETKKGGLAPPPVHSENWLICNQLPQKKLKHPHEVGKIPFLINRQTALSQTKLKHPHGGEKSVFDN
jgi:hypothetical protein